MTNSTVTKRKRTKKHLYFVVSTFSGIYKVFTCLQTAVDFYVKTLNNLSKDDKIKIGSYIWSDKDIEHFDLFYDEMLESSSNA